MTETKFLSPQAVSEILNVSCSTIKRWVDEGRLNAQKTPGGHRKIEIQEVLKLARENNWHHITLAKIESLAASESNQLNINHVSMQLYQAIREENQEKVRRVLTQAYGSGIGIADIGDHIVMPAMQGLGEDWSKGIVDICQEHHATQGVLAALMEIRQKQLASKPTDEKAPLAMGCAAEGDPYLIPTLLCELLFLEDRWRVVHFGPNTPLDSLLKSAKEKKPRILWVSATHLPNFGEFQNQLRSLSLTSSSWGGEVFVGGQAFHEQSGLDLDGVVLLKSLSQIKERIRKILPTYVPPKPGRPSLGNP